MHMPTADLRAHWSLRVCGGLPLQHWTEMGTFSPCHETVGSVMHASYCLKLGEPPTTITPDVGKRIGGRGEGGDGEGGGGGGGEGEGDKAVFAVRKYSI